MVFRVYNRTSWQEYFIIPAKGGYARSSKAFLFSLKNQLNRQFKMLQDAYYSHAAIHDYAGYGPTFGGGHDLNLRDSCNSNTRSKASLGHTYREPTGHGGGSSQVNSLLAGSRNFRCDEYEVFFQAWGDFSSEQRTKKRKTALREKIVSILLFPGRLDQCHGLRHPMSVFLDQ